MKFTLITTALHTHTYSLEINKEYLEKIKACLNEISVDILPDITEDDLKLVYGDDYMSNDKLCKVYTWKSYGDFTYPEILGEQIRDCIYDGLYSNEIDDEYGETLDTIDKIIEK